MAVERATPPAPADARQTGFGVPTWAQDVAGGAGKPARFATRVGRAPGPSGPMRRWGFRFAPAVLALAAASVGFGVGGAWAYEVTPVADGGVVSGVVRFVGRAPRLEPVRVNKNRDICGPQKESEALRIGPDGGVQDSVILLHGIARGRKPPSELVVDNHQCRFVPHVSAVMVGMRVRVRNSDPILHNTHGVLAEPGGSRRTVFNLALPLTGQVIEVTRKLTQVGPVRLLCDAHPHMEAWLYVHDSPYAAVTDGRGRFRLEGVPPGTYRVSMWHEGFRARGVDKDGRPVYEDPAVIAKEVTVPPRGAVTVEFELR